MAEFIKIVDSHVPIPPPAPTAQQSSDSGDAASESPHIPTLAFAPTGDPKDAAKDEERDFVLDEETLEKRKMQLWDGEWKLIDSYRKGYVSFDELRSFLSSCSFLMPVPDLIRFLEMYADPTYVALPSHSRGLWYTDTDSAVVSSMPEEPMVLTKTEFLRFRRDYSNANDAVGSDHELSSDDEGGEGDFVLPEFTARGTNRTGSADPDASVGGDASESARTSEQVARPRYSKRRSSLRSISMSGEIVVDPGAFDQSDDDEEEDESPSTGVQEALDFGFE